MSKTVLNPFSGQFDFVDSGAEISYYDLRYLKLDQSTPQDISGGQPDFLAGLRAGSTNQLSIDASGNIVTTGTLGAGAITSDTTAVSQFKNGATIGLYIDPVGTGGSGPRLSIGADPGASQYNLQVYGNIGIYAQSGFRADKADRFAMYAPFGGMYLDGDVANYLKGGLGVGGVDVGTYGKLQVSRDGQLYNSEGTAGLSVNNKTTPAKMLYMGYDTTRDAGYIQSIYSGSDVKPLLLNAFGGNVGVGTGAILPIGKFNVRSLTDVNFVVRAITDASGTHSDIYSANDANNAYQPFSINGSSLLLNQDSGGNVGIGLSTSPTSALHVYKANAGNGNTIVANIFRNTGSFGGSTILQVGDGNGTIDMELNSGYSGTGWRYGTYADFNLVNNYTGTGGFNSINLVTGGIVRLRVMGGTGATGGNIAIRPTGTGTGILAPTAYLHIGAGTATAGTAPLKFTAGTNTTVAVAGQVEYTTGVFHIRSDRFLLGGATDDGISTFQCNVAGVGGQIASFKGTESSQPYFIVWDKDNNQSLFGCRAGDAMFQHGSGKVCRIETSGGGLGTLVANKGIFGTTADDGEVLQVLGTGTSTKLALSAISDFHMTSTDRARFLLGNDNTAIGGSRSSAILFYGYDDDPVYGGTILQTKWEFHSDMLQNGVTNDFGFYDSRNARYPLRFNSEGITHIGANAWTFPFGASVPLVVIHDTANSAYDCCIMIANASAASTGFLIKADLHAQYGVHIPELIAVDTAGSPVPLCFNAEGGGKPTIFGSYTVYNATDILQVAGNLYLNGKLTKYNAISVVSNAIPTEYATVDLTTQAAAIGTTTLYAVPAGGAGMYRISYTAKVTRAATTSSILGALTIGYTDADATTPTIVSTTNIGNTTTSLIQDSVIVYAKASTNITYAMAYTSVGATTMQYNLHIKCECL